MIEIIRIKTTSGNSVLVDNCCEDFMKYKDTRREEIILENGTLVEIWLAEIDILGAT